LPYTSVTRTQFRALLLERLGASGTTFYRVTELNYLLQESLRFWNLCTSFWVTRVLFNTVTPVTPWYQLPSTITGNMRISWQNIPLSVASLHDLDYGRPNWESETTATGGDVPTVPKLWTIGALNLIAIWPADSAPPNSLVVDGIASTPILTSDTSTLDIGQEEMKSLLDYCEHVAMLKQGGKEFQDSQALFKAFLKAAGERSTIIRQSGVYEKWMGIDKGRWQKRVLTEGAEARLGAN
jgi:hypothetical protein